MSFERRVQRFVNRLQKEEQVQCVEQNRQRKILDKASNQQQEALEKDPRYVQIEEIANSEELRGALDAYTLEAGDNYIVTEHTEEIREGLLRRKKKRKLTETKTKVSGQYSVTYEEPSHNQPVGAFTVESILFPETEGIYEITSGRARVSVEVEITWREKEEARRSYDIESYGRKIKNYAGVNANPGLGITFGKGESTEEASPTVFTNLDSVLDVIAELTAKNRLKRMKQ